MDKRHGGNFLDDMGHKYVTTIVYYLLMNGVDIIYS